MSTHIELKPDSIILDVRLMKEENAAEHDFDVRKIATAAQARQREHPERMVTRIPVNEEQARGDQLLTRPVKKEEL